MSNIIAKAAHIYELMIAAITKINEGDINLSEKVSIQLLVEELNKDEFQGKIRFSLTSEELYKSYFLLSQRITRKLEKGHLGISCRATDYLNRLSKYVHNKSFIEHFGPFSGDIIWDKKKGIERKLAGNRYPVAINKTEAADFDNQNGTSKKPLSNQNIKKYLSTAVNRIKGVEFIYNYKNKPNRGANIEDIFIAPAFKEIINSKPQTKQETRKRSSGAIISNDNGAAPLTQIFNVSNEGVGFIADLGYGKTTLCQALFCVFAYRALGLSDKECFWNEFDKVKELNYVPILFSCNKVDSNIDISSVPDFIKESLKQVGFEDQNPAQKTILDELLDLYYGDTSQLLILVDALDEFDYRNGLEATLHRTQFHSFLKDELMTPDRNPVIYTKRDRKETIQKKYTIQFDILNLEISQQLDLIKKLLIHNGYEDEAEMNKLAELLISGLSPEIRKKPFNLTNAVYYFMIHNSVPDEDELEDALIEIFFERKRKGTYSKTINTLLVEIAMKMNNNEIEELALIKMVNKFYETHPDIKSIHEESDIINWLSHKIGILYRNNSQNGEVVIYQFQQKKYWDILLNKGKSKFDGNFMDLQKVMIDAGMSKNSNYPQCDRWSDVQKFADYLSYINKYKNKGRNNE